MYDCVKITNGTNYPVNGKVTYATFFCSDDSYNMAPDSTWQARSRGVCLVTEVTATVMVDSKPVIAQPYVSTGTGYSDFIVSPAGQGTFLVTRICNGTEDLPPKDHSAPTTQQK